MTTSKPSPRTTQARAAAKDGKQAAKPGKTAKRPRAKPDKELVIVTGISGAGKASAL